MDAANLIRDGTWSSRGIGYNDIPAAADIRHVEDENRVRERDAKGKGRAPLDDDDDGDSDDMGWEPAPTQEQAERRRRSGEAQYQYPTLHPNSDLSRHVHPERRRSRSDSASSAPPLDSHQRRVLWWKNAGINVMFIGAWSVPRRLSATNDSCSRAPAGTSSRR